MGPLCGYLLWHWPWRPVYARTSSSLQVPAGSFPLSPPLLLPLLVLSRAGVLMPSSVSHAIQFLHLCARRWKIHGAVRTLASKLSLRSMPLFPHAAASSLTWRHSAVDVGWCFACSLPFPFPPSPKNAPEKIRGIFVSGAQIWRNLQGGLASGARI